MTKEDVIKALKMCDPLGDLDECSKCPFANEVTPNGAWENDETSCYLEMHKYAADMIRYF